MIAYHAMPENIFTNKHVWIVAQKDSSTTMRDLLVHFVMKNVINVKDLHQIIVSNVILIDFSIKLLVCQNVQ
jgi:hypothetical protein